MPSQQHPEAKSRRVLFSVIALVVLLALGTGAAAMWKGLIPNPFSSAPSAPDVFAAFTQMTSAHTVTTINAGLEDRDANVEPIDFTVAVPAPKTPTPPSATLDQTDLLANFGDKTELGNPTSAITAPSVPTFLRLIPGDLSFNLKLTSDWQKAETLADTQTRVEGTYNANNIEAKLEFEIRKVGDKTYINPAKIPLPIPIIDLTVLSDKWIDADFSSSSTGILSYTQKTSTTTTAAPTVLPADPEAELGAWMKEAYMNGGIILGKAQKGSLNGENVWTYAVSFDGAKVRDAFLAVANDRMNRIGDRTYQIFTDKAIANMKDEAQSTIEIALLNAITGSISIRQSDKQPAGISIAVKIAPKTDNEKFQNKQIHITINTAFSKINEPIVVAAPDSPISFQQAIGMISGKTQAEMDFDQDLDVVKDIRKALEAYYKEKATYPATLQDLVGYKSDSFTVKEIPNDIFTNAPFIYQLTDTGFNLTYTVQFPEGASSSIQHQYAEGANTATATNLSVEAATLKDFDKDGLNAAQENDIGTSDYKADTDGDGFTDKEEVDGGFDPLMNSKTGKIFAPTRSAYLF